MRIPPQRIEWPTLALIALCYSLWGLSIFLVSQLWLLAAIVLTALCVALHSSLQHEIIHGHPFRSTGCNEALVLPALGLMIPFRRFRDTHIAHHNDEILTDPYDDPETNYLDPKIWSSLPAPLKSVLRFNNTLFGRILIGPLVGQVIFVQNDIAAMRSGNRQILHGWLLHIPSAMTVLLLVHLSPMPVWAYLISAYGALSILKIRTYLEHRAHPDAQGRTVVIEDRGPLALLFLNNNFHSVHHAHPGAPWYALPNLYAAGKDGFLSRNHGYRYASYGQVLRRHLLRAKDPVPHPLRPVSLDLRGHQSALTDSQEEVRHASASDHGERGLHAL